MKHTNPYLQAVLLCEGTTTDEQGRHNIYNEFSQCTMGYSNPFTILSIWRGGEVGLSDSYQEKIEIVAPDGRITAAGENGPFTLRDATYRQINSILLDHVDFTYEGVYQLRVTLIDSRHMVVATNEYPISVV